MTRGPDAIMERGSTVEMVLDRGLKFSETELAGLTPAAPRAPSIAPVPARAGSTGTNRPWPGN